MTELLEKCLEAVKFPNQLVIFRANKRWNVSTYSSEYNPLSNPVYHSTQNEDLKEAIKEFLNIYENNQQDPSKF